MESSVHLPNINMSLTFRENTIFDHTTPQILYQLSSLIQKSKYELRKKQTTSDEQPSLLSVELGVLFVEWKAMLLALLPIVEHSFQQMAKVLHMKRFLIELAIKLEVFGLVIWSVMYNIAKRSVQIRNLTY